VAGLSSRRTPISPLLMPAPINERTCCSRVDNRRVNEAESLYNQFWMRQVSVQKKPRPSVSASMARRRSCGSQEGL
jgi:hypothetical protein